MPSLLHSHLSEVAPVLANEREQGASFITYLSPEDAGSYAPDGTCPHKK